MVKLVYCVRRKAGMTLEEFQKRWLEVHGPLVKKLREQMPQVRRYVQSHTIAESRANDGLRASRGTRQPYDGITEVWFDGLEALLQPHAGLRHNRAAIVPLRRRRRLDPGG